MFISTSIGNININHITWFRVVDRDSGEICFSLAGEEGVRDAMIYTGELDALEQMGVVVPSTPGFFRLKYFHSLDDADGPKPGFVDSSPVVAWKIRPGEEWAEPICPDEPGGGNKGADAVKYPDGRVVEPFSAEYDNVEEWAKAKLEERRKRAQKK